MLAHHAWASYAASGGARSAWVVVLKSSSIQRSHLPWAGLIRHAMDQRTPALFWREPDTGLTLLGFGEADHFSGSDPGAMASAQQWVESYAERVERDDDLPLCWFSSTFDHQPGRSDWTDWPGLKLVVPKVLVAQRGDQVDVVFHGQSPEDLAEAERSFVLTC